MEGLTEEWREKLRHAGECPHPQPGGRQASRAWEGCSNVNIRKRGTSPDSLIKYFALGKLFKPRDLEPKCRYPWHIEDMQKDTDMPICTLSLSPKI